MSEQKNELALPMSDVVEFDAKITLEKLIDTAVTDLEEAYAKDGERIKEWLADASRMQQQLEAELTKSINETRPPAAEAKAARIKKFLEKETGLRVIVDSAAGQTSGCDTQPERAVSVAYTIYGHSAEKQSREATLRFSVDRPFSKREAYLKSLQPKLAEHIQLLHEEQLALHGRIAELPRQQRKAGAAITKLRVTGATRKQLLDALAQFKDQVYIPPKVGDAKLPKI